MTMLTSQWSDHHLVVDRLLNEDGLSIKPDDEEKIKLAKGLFRKKIPQELKELGFLQAVYNIVEENAKKIKSENDIFCQKGCSLCCNQIVNFTYLEMLYICEHIKKMQRSRQVKFLKIIKKTIKKVKSFYRQNSTNYVEFGDEYERKNYGLPCIFLDKKQNCSIYSVRPLICRTYRSSYDCSQHKTILEIHENKISRFEYFSYGDQSAYHMIAEEIQRMNIAYKEYPFAFWIIQEPFNKLF